MERRCTIGRAQHHPQPPTIEDGARLGHRAGDAPVEIALRNQPVQLDFASVCIICWLRSYVLRQAALQRRQELGFNRLADGVSESTLHVVCSLLRLSMAAAGGLRRRLTRPSLLKLLGEPRHVDAAGGAVRRLS
jgi:hypothetical protein